MGDAATRTTALAACTYPPATSSVRRARHFVEDRLSTVELDDLADDAGLLVAELASNAVLHARTDFCVALGRTVEGVRVEVSDASPLLPVFTAPGRTATSGRGLVLVQSLAARWGAHSSPTGKSVWCELDEASGDAAPELSIDDLLDLWDDGPGDSEAALGAALFAVAATAPTAGQHVVLPALPAAPLLEAKEHMDDLLRELQLVLLDRAPGEAASGAVVAGGGGDVAAELDAAAHRVTALRQQVREQVARAVAQGEREVVLDLDVTGSSRSDVARYARAVLAAERLSRSGALLTEVDDLSADRSVRSRYLDALLAALDA